VTIDNSITVFIADDHPVFRRGLKEIISADPRFIIAGESGEGSRVVEMVQELRPAVLLLDLNLPGLTGLEIASRLRDLDVPVKVIVLTMHKEEALFNKAMDLDVRGYVLKESAVQDIVDSIRAVAENEYYISPAISQYLVRRHTSRHAFQNQHLALEALSPTERKILKLVSENRTSKEIAELLYISPRTVENHRANICSKLNIHGSNGLLKFALEHRSNL
jgi:DNA-binding NarL/FixJ family response regulator